MKNIVVCRKCYDINEDEIKDICKKNGIKLSFSCVRCCKKQNKDGVIMAKSDGKLTEYKDKEELYSKMKNGVLDQNSNEKNYENKSGNKKKSGGSMIKKVLIGLAVVAIIFVCMILLLPKPGEVNKVSKFTREYTSEEKTTLNNNLMTLEDVKKYDGKNGNKAYIVIKNTVFDVSGLFKEGSHHGIKAGCDVTDQFLKSNHGLEVYKKLKVVGGIK